jgi:hypothetical protein
MLLALVLAATIDSTYDGRAKRIDVQIPRIDTAATIDGVLDEKVWTKAAKLTGFSQYQPVDGRPAEEPTEVLTWYSGDAIYFGIKATEIHGNVVHATQANRDDISSEDQVQILLDTDNGRQIAFLFGVNPLGVQQDGTRSAQFAGGAGGQSATGGGSRSINPLEGQVDLNPDYIFESKGRLTATGYEVEVRIPFKSLRYQDARTQTWGLHILRRIQHSGFQDTWAPAIRANANFFAQSGTLVGMHDMHRGLVLEATPTMTARADGAPTATSRHEYSSSAELGGDIKWGARQNLTLNGTVNPDFSQVEADIGQVLLNERFALFYPEKRPFFLDGLELFDTPNQLIYTRQIVAPAGGVKLAGKVAGTNIASMIVQDDRAYSWSGDNHPLFGIARIRHDFGPKYTLGSVLTTREDGDDYSRMAGADFRLYHSRLYFLQFQAAESWTDSLGTSKDGSLLQADWDRTGRRWGFHYTLRGVEPGYEAAAGFVNRTGLIEARSFNRFSFYGPKDALVQTYSIFVQANRAWNYVRGRPLLENVESVNPTATLRGGWQVSASASRNGYAFNPADYRGYEVQRAADTVAFAIPPFAQDQYSGSVNATTPTLRIMSATAGYSFGRTPIFREASGAHASRLSAAVDLRPTTSLRASLQISRLALDRRSDGSRFSSETIPRIKVEYQASRAMFFRLVTQYAARSRSYLRDVNGNRILVAGVFDEGSDSNEMTMDWLFSYRPVPGTLVYLGYGSTMDEANQFRFTELQRTRDGFFGKVSYLFRL